MVLLGPAHRSWVAGLALPEARSFQTPLGPVPLAMPAMELARAAITVNAIVPVAATAMTETVPFLKSYVDAMKAGLS